MIRAALLEASADELRVEVRTDDAAPRCLHYRSERGLWTTPAPTHDFVAVALAQYAAAVGHDLHVEGPVTAAQLDRLDELLQIWSVWRPGQFRRVTVTAEQEVDEPVRTSPPRGGAVLAYSGGVDASFALAAHTTRSLGRLSRTIALGLFVDGFDVSRYDRTGAARAVESARRALDAYEVPLAVVSTNWKDDFCPHWGMAHTSGLMAVMHTLSAHYSSAVHATDKNYLQEMSQGPWGSHMVVNHLLGRPGFPVISTGGTATRLERVQFLAEHPALISNLRVCFQDDALGVNCCYCEKCVRTQLELIACGLDTSAAFPITLKADDLMSVRARNANVIPHYLDVLRMLPSGHPWHDPLVDWTSRERQAVRERRRRRRLSARMMEER